MEIESVENLDEFPEYDHTCPSCKYLHVGILISEFGADVTVENICSNCGHKFIRYYYPTGRSR